MTDLGNSTRNTETFENQPRGTAVIDVVTIENELNPYLLYHSIGPTIVLVTQQVTGANKYNSLSRSMVIAISRKKK